MSSYFSEQNCSHLSSVQAGGRVHFIGVCGVAMGQLALALSRKGFAVSGSDKEFYPPMSTLLRQSSIKLFEQYSEENLTSEIDLAVVGNSVPASNPEVCAIEQLKLRYTCLPLLLSELVIGKRRSIVVTGTHGKTTTSALLAYLLEKLELNPSYFVGGACSQIESGLKISKGVMSVVEGDEYDSAFFAKIPKFRFYRPDILVINAIELDHVDIYQNVQEISRQFRWLVQQVPPGGSIFACADYPEVVSVAKSVQSGSHVHLTFFGEHGPVDSCIRERKTIGQTQFVTVDCGDGEMLQFETKLLGVHGARNAVAALLVVKTLVPQLIPDAILHLREFEGVKRRLQVLYEGARGVLFEDFAHHPTAVQLTLQGLRERYPSSRLIAAFEPRSNSSRQEVFRTLYEKAFCMADIVLLCDVKARPGDEQRKLIQVRELGRAISGHGTPCHVFDDGLSLGGFLLNEWKDGDVVVLMSNGSFDGLPGWLESELESNSKAYLGDRDRK